MTAAATVPRETKDSTDDRLELVRIDLVDVADNIRKDPGDVTELAASIAGMGLLQPIRVRESGDRYELVYGQRRLAAARMAGLQAIDAVVEWGGDVEPPGIRASTQLVENIQRADLNPLEEAVAIRAILDAEPGLTQAELAKRIGRSAPYVSNALRILELDAKVLPLVASGQLSGSHAKALASLKGAPQRALAQEAVEHGYSAHRLEERVGHYHEGQKREAEELAQLAKWAEGAEAVLIEKGADKATTVLTSTDGYGYSGAEGALKAMKARGWKVGSPSASYSRGKCDCNAFGVSKTWQGGVQAVRRCIVQAHYAAKNLAEGKKGHVDWQEQNRLDAARRARANTVRAAVRPVLEKALKQAPPDLVRILLWTAFGWQVNDWVKDHKGDRKKADAWGSLTDLSQRDLVDEATKRILTKFDDHSGVRLDWEAIATTFGVKLPAEKPAKKAKATS